MVLAGSFFARNTAFCISSVASSGIHQWSVTVITILFYKTNLPLQPTAFSSVLNAPILLNFHDRLVIFYTSSHYIKHRVVTCYYLQMAYTKFTSVAYTTGVKLHLYRLKHNDFQAYTSPLPFGSFAGYVKKPFVCFSSLCSLTFALKSEPSIVCYSMYPSTKFLYSLFTSLSNFT